MLLTALVLSPACKAPPEAPQELDELCGFIFEHFTDEDPAELAAGLGNLDTWLNANLEETLEGYEVTELSRDSVDALDENSRDLDGMVGAAVGTEGSFDPAEIAEVLVLVDPVELSPGMYEVYDRTFLTDQNCFVKAKCETLEVFNYMESTYPLGLDVTTETNGQYRWVDMETGTAMLQRTWMDSPAEVSVDWLSVQDQFYLNVVMPSESGSVRLQATWIVAQVINAEIPDGIALTLVIASMQDVYEDVDAYLEEQ